MTGLLGSFDPSLKQTEWKKYCNKYGTHYVHIIQRSKFFLFMKIIVPLCIYTIIYSLIIRAISYITEGDPIIIGYGAIIGLLLVIILFLAVHLKRLLDYLMDFIIVTPDQIIAYNQKGIWKRQNMTIETIKIKSMSVSYRGWIFSVFNNGDIKFLSEGDVLSGGEIQAYYVYQPQQTKEKIYEIIAQSQKNAHPVIDG